MKHADQSTQSYDQHADDRQTTPLGPDAPDGIGSVQSGDASSAGYFPRIEGYTILRVIASGGMGIVYEARQHEPERRVALKVIRSGLASLDAVRRFKREARVLGQLHHPGIAQIYQLGTFDTGVGTPQPYFAMELVVGLRLADHCNAARLGVRERLGLLIQICESVQHAHDSGIIHRDLKPENMIVDGSGQPKILDFGIARFGEGSDHTVHTETGAILGTIAYMSPEQISNHTNQIDSGSDVYSLGVVGFELLAGRLPIDVRGMSLAKAVGTITTLDPDRLSSVSGQFRGDLETIIGKALEKDKTRRYRAPEAFAADLRRYLSNQPIEARAPSTVYQLRKFAVRNKVLTAGVITTFVALAVGLVGTLTQARIAATNARQAESRRLEADESRLSAEREQYLADISLATLASSQGRVFEAETALLKAPRHLRRWEWGYLWRASHPELAVMSGHKDGIRYVDYSPDGGRLLSVSDDKTGRVWDPHAGSCVAVLEGHEKRILFGKFSPSGNLIATASDDHTARLWTPDGKLQHVLTGHSGPVNKAKFSPDGRRVLTISDDSTGRLWEAKSGTYLCALKGHTGPVWDADFDSSGQLIATASDDMTARLWDGFTGRALAVLRGHVGQVNAIRFHPKESRLATISEDGTARIWASDNLPPSSTSQIPDIQAIHTVALQMEMPRWLEFANGGSCLIVASRAGRLVNFNASTGEIIQGPIETYYESEGLAVSTSSNYSRIILATKNSEALFNTLDPNLHLSPSFEVFRGHRNYVTCAAFRPGGDRFATGSADGSVRVWSVTKSRRATFAPYIAGEVVSTRFENDGRLFLVDHREGWERVDPKTLSDEIPVTKSAPLCLDGDINPAGSEAVTIEAGGQMTIWRLDGENEEKNVCQTEGQLESVEYSPDGTLIVAAGPSNVATLWRAGNGSAVRRFLGHEDKVIQAVFGGMEDRVISISMDRTARIWNSQTGEPLAIITLEDIPSSVCVNPDAASCAVTLADNSVTICSLKTLKKATHFPTGQSGEHLWGVFTRDGSRLITGTSQEILKVWDASCFEELTALPKAMGIIHSMHFSRDGRFLALALDKFKVDLLDAGPGTIGEVPSQDHGED